MSTRYCKLFDSGYCPQQEDCQFFHAQGICESLSRGECDKILCMKRHPKMCKFGDRCNIGGACVFRHTPNSVMFVPGRVVEKKSRYDHIVLLESFQKAQEEGRESRLIFFTKDGRSTANMEIELTSLIDQEDRAGLIPNINPFYEN